MSSKKVSTFGAEYASPTPWTIEHVTRQNHAVVRGADGAIVLVCHADNAYAIVKAVNEAKAGIRKETEESEVLND